MMVIKGLSGEAVYIFANSEFWVFRMGARMSLHGQVFFHRVRVQIHHGHCAVPGAAIVILICGVSLASVGKNSHAGRVGRRSIAHLDRSNGSKSAG